MPDKIVALVNRVGVPMVYAATTNEDGSRLDAEVTSASAAKLTDLLGEKAVKFLRFKGTHVVVRITVAELEKAAAEAQKVSRGTGVEVEITSRIQYAVTTKTEGAVNDVTSAWWSADEMAGGITVNGAEYEIVPGLAKDYYREPEADSGKEWNPERTIYIVWLPLTDKDGVSSEQAITSYGVANLIRSVARRGERIG
jgi:hypothetical protein